jgi:hypothetical protein
VLFLSGKLIIEKILNDIWSASACTNTHILQQSPSLLHRFTAVYLQNEFQIMTTRDHARDFGRDLVHLNEMHAAQAGKCL